MSNIGTRLLRWLAALGALMAMYWRSRAAVTQAKADEERAEQAEADTRQLTRINSAREQIEQQHQKEQLDEESRLNAGDRSHFSDRW